VITDRPPSREVAVVSEGGARRVRTAHAVTWGIFATMLVALFGIVARFQVMLDGLARPMATNIFFRLYALYEQPFLLLLLATAIVMAVMTRRAARSPDASWLDAIPLPDAGTALVLGGLVFVVTVAVTHLVLHGYAFSMDEFSADFQARLFARGQYEATLPPFWRPFAGGLIPVFVGFHPATWTWISVYLPVYSALKAPFVALGLGTLLNPLLAGLSIAALIVVTRRLWPNERLRPWVAILALATSSEFLVTSGSAYSMPAHLLLNLVWLWLYLRGDARSWAFALVVGVLALGLHNPFPHALFVAPFLLRLARERKWHRLGAAAVVYGAAAVVWLAWLGFARTPSAGGPGITSVFSVPNLQVLWLQGINVALLFTWQAPLVGLLVVAALCRARQFPPVLADLAWGVLLTLLVYMCFPSTQGHGWGYRYAYQVLGNIALLAAAGAPALVELTGRRRAGILLAASFVVAALVQLPLRFVDTERFVRPFAAGAEYVQTRSADVVLIHGDSIWYGRDLLRNDPFLEGQPVVIYSTGLTPAGRAYLEHAFPGRVVEVSDSELLKLGMTRWTSHP
jgi:hypothetical protein